MLVSMGGYYSWLTSGDIMGYSIGYWRNDMYYLGDGGITCYDGLAYLSWVHSRIYEVYSLSGTRLGLAHRLDGPVFEGDEFKSWFIGGEQYFYFKDFQEAGGLSDEAMMVLRLKYGEIL